MNNIIVRLQSIENRLSIVLTKQKKNKFEIVTACTVVSILVCVERN